jgi:arsenate reductase (thioredoxin)
MDLSAYPELLTKIQNRRLRVLFVCLGNASRSQMAEAFANAYGPDVIDARSAGLTPARSISSVTRLVMEEKEIHSLRTAAPQGMAAVDLARIDLIINMSGHALPSFETPVIRVAVRDPNGKDEAVHRQARDRIEGYVIELVKSLRDVRLQRYEGARAMAASA